MVGDTVPRSVTTMSQDTTTTLQADPFLDPVIRALWAYDPVSKATTTTLQVIDEQFIDGILAALGEDILKPQMKQ